MTQEKTIFEKIVLGEIPSYKVYEDENTFAFLDINPNRKGHTLVIIKQPYRNILDLPEDLVAELFKTVQKISVAVKEAVSADGINIVMNNESSAGQLVFHNHVHIIPRNENDTGYYGIHVKYEEGEALKIAQKISELIK